MADAEAAADARRKAAEARKAKIASRGADRLAKITSTARGGDDAAERFGSDIASSSRPATPGAAKPTVSASTPSNKHTLSSPTRQTLPDLAAPSFDPLDDPPEIDISQAPSRSRAVNNSLAPFPGAPGQDDKMPDMFSMLFGGAQGQGDAAGGMGGLPPGFENLASMFGGAAGASPMTVAPPRPKSWTDRLQPLVHLTSMVFLAFYAVFVLEPKIRNGYGTSLLSLFTSGNQAGLQDVGDIDINGWAALGRGKQGGSGSSGLAQAIENTWEASGRGVATVQITYLFLVMELLLQSVALTLFKSRPPIPGLLGTISTYLPPQYASYLHTGMRYYALLGQILDDLAVLVLSLVGWILFAEYRQFGWASVGKVKLQ